MQPSESVLENVFVFDVGIVKLTLPMACCGTSEHATPYAPVRDLGISIIPRNSWLISVFKSVLKLSVDSFTLVKPEFGFTVQSANIAIRRSLSAALIAFTPEAVAPLLAHILAPSWSVPQTPLVRFITGRTHVFILCIMDWVATKATSNIVSSSFMSSARFG